MNKRGNPKKTTRYGNFASPSDLSKSETSGNLFSDNSIEDKNYSPEKKRSKKDNTPKDMDEIDLNDDFISIQSYLSNNSVGNGKAIEKTQKNSDKCTSTVSPAADIDVNLLSKMYENSVEILARLAVIENSLIKNGLLKQVKPEKKSTDAVNAFMLAHHLPLKSLEHIQKFESNLENESVKITAVSTFIHDFSFSLC